MFPVFLFCASPASHLGLMMQTGSYFALNVWLAVDALLIDTSLLCRRRREPNSIICISDDNNIFVSCIPWCTCHIRGLASICLGEGILYSHSSGLSKINRISMPWSAAKDFELLPIFRGLFKNKLRAICWIQLEVAGLILGPGSL